MPAIVTGHCSTCGYSDTLTDKVIAIVVDEDSTHHCVHPDCSRLVILAHPVEDNVLNDLHYTYRKAGCEGRLLAIHYRVCPACGTSYEQRVPFFPTFMLGCLPAIVVSLVAGITTWWFTRRIGIAVEVALLTLPAFVCVSDAIMHRLLRFRERHHQFSEYDRPDVCPHCRHTGGLTPTKIRRPLPCPQCTQSTLKYTSSAIS